MPIPALIAHRGASQDAPENTLRAFALARAQGADSIELDAMTTRDDQVVCFHDWTLPRLCGVNGKVRRCTLSELRALRVRGEPIPTLEEALVAEDRPKSLVVELKAEAWNDVKVAALAIKAIRRTGALARGPIVLSSFHPLALVHAWRLAPEIPRALLAWSKTSLPARRLWARPFTGATEAHLDPPLIDAGLVGRMHRRGRKVIAWTVNDPAEALRLADLGVDGLITDVPAVLRAAFAARG